MARRSARFEAPELPAAGGVITALLRRTSAPGEVVIRLGRKNAGQITEAQAKKLGVGEGVEWTDRLRDAVGAAMLRAEAREWAARAVSRRAMSRSMLVGKLRQRGLDPTTSIRIAEDLAAKGMIDEKVFAEGVVETTIARKGAGKRLLVMRLRNKGIDSKTAGEVVERVTEQAGYDQREAAVDLARRKLRVMGDRLAPEAKQRRLYALLARRGFDAELCRDVVWTVCRPSDD